MSSPEAPPVVLDPTDSSRDPSRSIAEALSGRDNAFNFLRLVFALLVIVDHAFPLGGFGADPMWGWSNGQDSMGGISVAAFFAISGYLITQSATKGDLLQFMWNRILRIFPAYWFVLIFTMGVIAPIIWWSEGRAWAGFAAPGICAPRTYFSANWTLEIGQFCIGDLLRSTTPYGRSIGESVFNGSLWTLIYEWRCYLLVGLLAVGGVLKRARTFYALVTLFAYVMLLLATAKPELATGTVSWLTDIHAIRFTAVFLIGGLLYLYSNEIPLDDRLGWLSLVLFGVALFKGGYYAIGYPSLAYALLWLAHRLPKRIRAIGAKADYSYGVYIYGFLVQQLLAHLGVHRAGLAAYILISIAVTYVLAMASWYGIEKPSLQYKRMGPGRGWEYWLERARLRTGRKLARVQGE